MNDNGTCVTKCPWGTEMDPDSGRLIKVEKKYQFARYCLSECPRKLMFLDRSFLWMWNVGANAPCRQETKLLKKAYVRTQKLCPS